MFFLQRGGWWVLVHHRRGSGNGVVSIGSWESQSTWRRVDLCGKITIVWLPKPHEMVPMELFAGAKRGREVRGKFGLFHKGRELHESSHRSGP